jgi:transposase
MCLRGFDFVAAATFVAEAGDLHRFAHPRELLAYLGLVPSEYTSGETRHQGPTTKTGNKHARRILVEPPGITATAHVSALSWRFGSRVRSKLFATSPGVRNCA